MQTECHANCYRRGEIKGEEDVENPRKFAYSGN